VLIHFSNEYSSLMADWLLVWKTENVRQLTKSRKSVRKNLVVQNYIVSFMLGLHQCLIDFCGPCIACFKDFAA